MEMIEEKSRQSQYVTGTPANRTDPVPPVWLQRTKKEHDAVPALDKRTVKGNSNHVIRRYRPVKRKARKKHGRGRYKNALGSHGKCRVKYKEMEIGNHQRLNPPPYIIEGLYPPWP
jgi:hypothetical protein